MCTHKQTDTHADAHTDTYTHTHIGQTGNRKAHNRDVWIPLLIVEVKKKKALAM